MAFLNMTYLICYSRASNALKRLDQQREAIEEISKEIAFLHEVWDSVVEKTIADKFASAKAELLEANGILSESFANMKGYISQCNDLDSLWGGKIQNIADSIG